MYVNYSVPRRQSSVSIRNAYNIVFIVEHGAGIVPIISGTIFRRNETRSVCQRNRPKTVPDYFRITKYKRSNALVWSINTKIS